MHRPVLALPAKAVLAGLATAIAAWWPAVPAQAADDPSPRLLAPRTDRLAAARKLVAAQQWREALVELRRNADATDADWNNLMGFALRKNSPPDLALAEKHYDAALRIEPLHRGALEYSGELYLVRGELARAEKRLAELETACPQGCKEHGDLERAIEQHKKTAPAAR